MGHGRRRRAIAGAVVVLSAFVLLRCRREGAPTISRETIASAPIEPRPTDADPCTRWPEDRPPHFRAKVSRSLLGLGTPDAHQAVEVRGPDDPCTQQNCQTIDAAKADALYDQVRHEDLVGIRDADHPIHDPHIFHGEIALSFDGTQCLLGDGWALGDSPAFDGFIRVQNAIIDSTAIPTPPHAIAE